MTFIGKMISCLLAMIFMIQSTLGGPISWKHGENLRVSAYLIADNAETVENMDVSHLKDITDLILIAAPARFNAEGEIILGDEFDGIIAAACEKTQGYDIKLHLTLSGPEGIEGDTWEEQMESQSEQHRLAFCSGVLEENIKSLLYHYPLDGVSFDYEYPLTEQRKKEYGDFLVSLKEVLGDTYTLSCALSSWCADFSKKAIRAIDRVELMCYDNWDPITRAHSSLRTAKDQIMKMLLLGYRREQIDLGLPLYARPTNGDAIWYNYNNCYDKIDKLGLMEDEENGVTASFNTPDLIYAKTRYAILKRLGGVMLWHYGADVPADNEASLINAVIKARGPVAQYVAYEEDRIPLYEYDQKLVSCVPAQRQILHARTEFYAFFHFGVNTFTDREWGDGTEDPAIFDPTDFDAGQWIDAAAAAGMKGVILTAKHHDGFCLWPSQYTEHSVKNSPFRNGNGDVVREVADACRERGMKFGIYLSPWDRHEPTYGQGKAYDDYFCNQLTELLTNYGELFSVWFDGACGEGPNGKTQSYDWDRYYAVVRRYQPNACMAISGPDVRWCGNEAGETRESEWSVLPTSYFTPEEVAANSQHAEGAAFRPKTGDLENRDFGGREYLKGARGLHWYPSETDTSIRPGWFYHASENKKVKSSDTLIDLWYRTVGGNSSLLLNIPPDRSGRISSFDVKSLKGLGDYLKKTFSVNLAETASITADKTDGAHTADALKADSYDAYYKAPDGETVATVTVSLAEPSTVSHAVIKEHIPMSQRVERFAVDVKLTDGTWKKVAEGTTVGYQKVVKFNPVQTDAVRVRILDSRVCPVLSFIGVY